MIEKVDRKTARAARKEQRQLENAARGLNRRMIRFSQDERFAVSLAAALPIYWDNYYDIETADEMDMTESLRFFDWFFHDYTPNAETPTLFATWVAEQGEDLSDREKEVVDSWKDTAAPSAYIFNDYDSLNAHFKLTEFFTGEELIAKSPAGFGNSKKGDLILVRILPVGSARLFSTVGAFIPQDEIRDLKEKIEAAREADPDGDHNSFMRRNSHLVVHHAMAMSVDEGRFAVSRLDPTRMDKAVKRAGKTMVKKFKKKVKRK
ncbi:MAG: hypothetical protein ACI9EW_003715 [Cellvibrionaceae bacterium]|jgi:hypothetical protein